MYSKRKEEQVLEGKELGLWGGGGGHSEDLIAHYFFCYLLLILADMDVHSLNVDMAHMYGRNDSVFVVGYFKHFKG